MADAVSGMLSVHESCPVCAPDPDVVLVHTPIFTITQRLKGFDVLLVGEEEMI